MMRYLRLFRSFAKFSLLGEMAFRANYLFKVSVELAWLGMMMYFYDTIFDSTELIAGWTKNQYFFFVGTYWVLESVIETFFMANVGEFSELVRTGTLDFILLKPVDEQFLVTTRHVEFSTLPNVLFGGFLMTRSIILIGEVPSVFQILAFIIGMIGSVALAYSFLLMLASSSVWMVRNQSLYEVWWLFVSLMRYPREIFNTPWTSAVGWFFTFMIPVALAVNVPANAMVRVLDPAFLAYLAVAAAALLWLSRWVFRRALQSYRSASS